MSNAPKTYLSFKVKDHTFGVDVEKVLEIREYSTPSPIPDSPSYFLGVIEYQNQVIPLVDCGEKFGLKPLEINSQTCLVILEVFNENVSKRFKIGIVVDDVSEVFEGDNEKLMSMDEDYRPGYLMSSYKIDDTLVLILNVNKVFSDKDVILIDDLINKLG